MNGPTIIFDKSALQTLSVDESCWLDNFFVSNITPLFYVETLADLEKRAKPGKTPEQVVGTLALKTPSMNCFPNVHHDTLVVGNLLGFPVKMANRTATIAGQAMQSALGVGIHYQRFAELQALQRWRDGDYLAIEHNIARHWRQQLSDFSFAPWLALVNDIAPQRFRDLSGVKAFVDQFILRVDDKFLSAYLYLQKVPSSLSSEILRRWAQGSRPDLPQFAPYAAHILKVDVFFYLSLASDLISKGRPSNRADIAYLYYLPFTMVFTSDDRLHHKTAPLFMEMNQVFVCGQELKSALGKLDAHYWQLPDEIKDQGIIKFSPRPPKECETLVSALWDKFLPSWRESAKKSGRPSDRMESGGEMTVEFLEKVAKDATPIGESGKPLKPVYTYLPSEVPRKKGKWNIVPHDLD